MRHAVGIAAHTSRMEWVDELSAQVKPDSVVWDDGTAGAGLNHLAVLTNLYQQMPDAWLVVLEDDSLPVERFRDQMSQALAVAPTKIVSFYLGTGYPAQYQQRFTDVLNHPGWQPCWILHRQLRHGVAYAIHPDVSLLAISHMQRLIARNFAPDDALGAFASQNGEPVAYSNPSLVDHRDAGTVVDVRMHLGHPTAPGRKRPRRAHRVGTRSTWHDTHVVVWPL